MATQHRLLKDFFMPYLEIRNKGQGYAVSIVKAGAKIVGHDAGPVRPPLTELKPDEERGAGRADRSPGAAIGAGNAAAAGATAAAASFAHAGRSGVASKTDWRPGWA